MAGFYRALHTKGLHLVSALALAGAAAAADGTNGKKLVDGLAVYLGVVPAELVRGRASGHGARGMHDSTRTDDAGQYHVMVALFDAATGARVTDARIVARVDGAGRDPQKKALEPMLVVDALTYANYFTMIGTGPFEVVLQISRASLDYPLEVRFERRHH